MDILKFELSVLFTKQIVNVLSGNNVIKKEYEVYFRKEVSEDEIAVVVDDIIKDQYMYGEAVREIPEDFELYDIRDR
jgi:hypothetical protein